jgi:anti-sigma regulatory factor (Ser/Thr protein kinase)
MPVSVPIDRREVRRSFDPVPTSSRAARSWCDPVLVDWGLGDRRPDAALVLSELVANAVRHGAGPIEVTLSQRPGALRIAVSDAGPATEITAMNPGPTTSGGRGLAIVEHFACAWGVRVLPEGGKTVWAALPIHDQ